MPLFKKLALAWHVGRGPVDQGDEPRAHGRGKSVAPFVTFSILGARYHALSLWLSSGQYDTGGLAIDVEAGPGHLFLSSWRAVPHPMRRFVPATARHVPHQTSKAVALSTMAEKPRLPPFLRGGQLAGFRCASVRVARIAFQACAFNHSAISAHDHLRARPKLTPARRGASDDRTAVCQRQAASAFWRKRRIRR
jgi:hypothetical protein